MIRMKILHVGIAEKKCLGDTFFVVKNVKKILLGKYYNNEAHHFVDGTKWFGG